MTMCKVDNPLSL